MAKKVLCPACAASADEYLPSGDSETIVCPHCGGFKLARTVRTELENGTATLPEPEAFKALVQRKRGDREEYPTITSYDL